MGSIIWCPCEFLTDPHKMAHKTRKKHCPRKKVIRKGGKRYYRAGKSGLRRLKGRKKPPKRKC